MDIIDGICILSEHSNDGLSAGGLLESMNMSGITRAVIRCDDRHAAVACVEGNSYIKAYVDAYPNRFYGFATANPWLGTKAVLEIENRLQEGFSGVFFTPCVQGFMSNDKMIYPILEKCEQYNTPVYFHTGTPMQALPFQILSLAKRYPSIPFIIGHMGANDFVGDAFAAVKQAQNIYIETSLNLTVNMRNAAALYSNRMIFGSCSPRSMQCFELKKIRQAVADDTILKKICAKNLQKLLGGVRP